MIILKNKWREPFEILLHHDPVCWRRGECKCTIVDVVGPDGAMHKKALGKSLRIDALATTAPLDNEVLFLGQVKDAITAGRLELIRVADAATPAIPAATPASDGKKGKKE